MKIIAFFFLLFCFLNTTSEIIRQKSPSVGKHCNFETAMFLLKRDVLNTLNDKVCQKVMLNNTVRPTIASRCYGYCAGLEWDDLADTCDRVVGIRAIKIFYDDRQINSIQVTYILASGSVEAGGPAEVSAARHGDSSGSGILIRLGDKERFIGVEGSSRDNFISHLTFTSENERGNKTVHGPYGQPGQERFAVNGYILGLKGFSNNSVNGISVYYLPPLVRSSNTFGGSCSNTFHDDKVDSIIPPVVGISMVKIQHGCVLDGIQFIYLLLDGSRHTGSFIGGTGGGQTLLHLLPDEAIYRLEFFSSADVVGIIAILTRFNVTKFGNGLGNSQCYTVGNPMQVSGNILGVYGYSRYDDPLQNRLVCKIGVYTVD